MNQNDLHTGIEFARAVAKHFKLPDTADADMEIVTGANEVFGVKVKLTLTADDLIGIAQHMGATGKTAGLEPIRSLVKMTMARGDVLVLKVPSTVSREQNAKIKEHIRTELGADVRILVVDGAASLAVLGGLDAAGDGVTGD